MTDQIHLVVATPCFGGQVSSIYAGSVFHLQKALGHSTLEMTRRYVNLVAADLQAVHERVPFLSK